MVQSLWSKVHGSEHELSSCLWRFHVACLGMDTFSDRLFHSNKMFIELQCNRGIEFSSLGNILVSFKSCQFQDGSPAFCHSFEHISHFLPHTLQNLPLFTWVCDAVLWDPSRMASSSNGHGPLCSPFRCGWTGPHVAPNQLRSRSLPWQPSWDCLGQSGCTLWDFDSVLLGFYCPCLFAVFSPPLFPVENVDTFFRGP